MRSVLIVGGTGPTGHALVRRVLAAGDVPTIVHTGRHEIDFDGPVEHVHCDPRSREDLAAALGGRTFDAAVSTSGRLTEVISVLAGRVGALAAVTGLPAYAGWLVPPGRSGRPVPLRETDPPTPAAGGGPGDGLTARVQENERAVLEAAAGGAFRATVLRYTMVYGPHSYIPFEWYFARRVRDGRRRLALEADGLMLPQRGYSANLAAAVLLALDDQRAAGRVFNVGDEQVLSVRSIAETVAAALGHEFEIVPVPLAASPCANPMALRQNTIFDLGAIRELGYRDVLPVAAATARYATWLAAHPPGPAEEAALGARAFDYAAEDRVLDVYTNALEEVR